MTRNARRRPGLRGAEIDHHGDVQAEDALPARVTDRPLASTPLRALRRGRQPLPSPQPLQPPTPHCQPRSFAGLTEPAAPKTFLTIPEVAGILRVSTRTVRRLVGGGALACVRVGRSVRISVAALDAFCGQVSERNAFNDSS
jgi:excisionase family DNA binding protein